MNSSQSVVRSIKKRDDLVFVQVICAISVVVLHTNGCFWSYSTERYWKTANIIECVFYFPVPLFFMISAITLIDFPEEYSLKEYFSKRLNRVVIPFFAWNLIGLAYKLAHGYISASSISLPFLWEGFAGTTFVSIYWYFNSQIRFYLSLPLFAAVNKKHRIRVFTYLAIAIISVNYMIPFIKRVFELSFSWPYIIDVGGGYLIFAPLGIVLDDVSNKQARSAVIVKCVIYFWGIAGFLCI